MTVSSLHTEPDELILKALPLAAGLLQTRLLKSCVRSRPIVRPQHGSYISQSGACEPLLIADNNTPEPSPRGTASPSLSMIHNVSYDPSRVVSSMHACSSRGRHEATGIKDSLRKHAPLIR